MQFPFYRTYTISEGTRYPIVELQNNRKEIRILVVVARPARESDLPYSDFTRNLIDCIDRTKYTVYLHVLSCGTEKALFNQLKDRGSGFYDIIHFDVHGGK